LERTKNTYGENSQNFYLTLTLIGGIFLRLKMKLLKFDYYFFEKKTITRDLKQFDKKQSKALDGQK